MNSDDCPPADDTRLSVLPAPALYTIVPSWLQVPPRMPSVMHSVCGGPPLAAIFNSFCCAKYAMNRLSGDQNGNAAPSVLGSGCAVSESMGRIHNRTLPDASRAVNASLLPSGETLTLVPVRLDVTNVELSGGSTKNRVTDGVVGRDADHQAVAPATVVSASNTATACHARN